MEKEELIKRAKTVVEDYSYLMAFGGVNEYELLERAVTLIEDFVNTVQE